MATTWQDLRTTRLSPDFQASISDDLPYEFKRAGGGFTYSVEFNGTKLTLPIDVLIGGQRHGLGFLASIRELDGIPLTRPALVQARYEWSPEKKRLLLAPGCVLARPQKLEAALGVVLSPAFEKRCLSCHGQPNSADAGIDNGVRCESCHGPGAGHLAAVNQGNPRQGIVNPKRLSSTESTEVCARCHVGLTKFSDPSPDDLLIANQVTALRSSECFQQSGKALSCVTCHDPHDDTAGDTRAANACLSCHAAGVSPHAAICPVDATSGCLGCHMPSVEVGALHLVDHVIRVHPEQVASRAPDPTTAKKTRTQVTPVSAYLRIITTISRPAAEVALKRLRGGESFYAVARDASTDDSSAIGGYMGRRVLAELNPTLRGEAARLDYGEISGVFKNGSQWAILLRLPRDFRWQAEELERQAEALAGRNEAVAAIGKAQEALTVYPHFLRALNLIGATLAANGNPKRASEVLVTATHLYPADAQTQFALASTLELLHDGEGAARAYKRAIALEEDFTAAYANLGLLACSAGDWENAISTFRRGLQINPLSSDLNYGLGLALNGSGDDAAAKQAFALALKLDPSLQNPTVPKPQAPRFGEAIRQRRQ